MMFKSNGTKDNIDIIVNRYAQMIYRLAYARTCSKDDAQDVLQEVFLRYVRRCPKFKNSEHEKAWFIKVTINCSKNVWRNSKVQLLTLDEQIVSNEYMKIDNDLGIYLLKLPQDYKTVIHLYYYEDFSTIEISKILNKRESTVRTQLTRARKMLKDYMNGDEYYV